MSVHRLLTFGALLVLGGAPALAGRAVTDDERAKLVSAVSAQGCSGGKRGSTTGNMKSTTSDATTARFTAQKEAGKLSGLRQRAGEADPRGVGRWGRRVVARISGHNTVLGARGARSTPARLSTC